MQDVKKFLEKAQKIDCLITAMLAELDFMKKEGGNLPSQRYEQRIQRTKIVSLTEERVIKIIQYEEKIDGMVDQLIHEKQKIQQVIQELEDEDEIAVLTLKYKCYYTNEEIGEALHFSTRQVYRIKEKGLQHLIPILQKQNKKEESSPLC